MMMGILLPSRILAAQKKISYINNSLSAYSGYDELIQALKKKHPTWTFTILYTGLDWNEVIKNETVAVHGRNLIYYTNGGSWVCSTCGDKLYDTGKWKCASETAVAYYMDPRNWINENNIFQFEDLSYNEDVQTDEGVQKILDSVTWATGDKITYTNTKGETKTLKKSYAEVIMEAAEESGVSPYHLAARIKQEQGAGSTASSTGCGTYSGYVGYYNFFNIKATGSNVIANALAYAKTCDWTDPEKSIIGGAQFIAKEYISRGQSTLYLQKFDVDNTDGALYYHQYMQNVSAAVTEGQTVKSSYESMDLLSSSINFVIPVYENMPAEVSPSPDGITLVTQNVQVTADDVVIRKGRSTDFAEVTTVKKGTKLLRIETATIKQNGYYWDKVVLSNGTAGYIARDYIKVIDDITNANKACFASTAVNLRNGPGINETKVVTILTAGQALTVIEEGKYKNVDGYDWSRVKLANGTQGYMVSTYLTEKYLVGYINCSATGKVNIRKEVGTTSSIVTSLANGTKVTVVEKAAGTTNGYTWDKIVTGDGLVGYVANSYLKYEESEGNSDKTNSNDANTSTSTNTKTYELGDVNLDGEIDSADLLAIQKHLLNVKKITDETKLKNADVNKDGEIDSADLLRIQKYLLGVIKSL